MKFRKTTLAGVLVVEPDVHRDARGFFLESYHEEKYQAGGIAERFVQDNHSCSKRGTLRGLHAQLGPAQGKLVRVVRGEILDVAVDVRTGSPTFGQHHAETLDADAHRQLWIPEGFLHGFLVLSEEAEVEYKVTTPYSPSGEIAVAWNDPEIAIPWPETDPTVSERDAAAPPLSAVRSRLASS
ncbi:MAG: dTDP-4-dehydrorhamnose 3,5-epimerase [bacterium]|nr:dTDP-4-dehydrorhamnose 3,5-epimerase [bacterium]MCP5069820.1 dTDP-4-dehydrorhamnose 3,5-epimerase [bacterium]